MRLGPLKDLIPGGAGSSSCAEHQGQEWLCRQGVLQAEATLELAVAVAEEPQSQL